MQLSSYDSDVVQVVEIYSDRDCPAGDQLLEAYGESNNGFLAQWFGFVPDPNPSDILRYIYILSFCNYTLGRLRWKFQPGQGEAHEEKLKMLNMFAGRIRSDFNVRRTARLPSFVLYYLQLTTLPASKAHQCSRSESLQLLINCIQTNRPRTLFDELEQIVKERIAEWSTTLDQDRELLETYENQPVRALAVRYRMHQKEIANHVLEQIRKERDQKIEL